MDIPANMFTYYELITFILIINYETFSRILVKNESTIALLEGKLLNMTESIFYMQFKMVARLTVNRNMLMVGSTDQLAREGLTRYCFQWQLQCVILLR